MAWGHSYQLITVCLSLARSFETAASYNIENSIIDILGNSDTDGNVHALAESIHIHFLIVFFRFDTGKSFFFLSMLDIHSMGEPALC